MASVDPNDRYAQGPYRCISCGNLMVPALGKTRKHHFKHKAGRPENCADETYLHQLGKNALFDALSDAIRHQRPYPLIRSQSVECDRRKSDFGIICTHRKSEFLDDLAKRFDSVELEKGVNGFVADILLTSSETGEFLLLEIAVTHRCEKEKINSGVGIVEIKIRCEEDIEPLRHEIATAAPNVICYNLQEPAALAQRCDHPCSVNCMLFLLYDNGKAWYSQISSSQIAEFTADPNLVAWQVIDAWSYSGGRTSKPLLEQFKKALVEQHLNSPNRVKSCMLCQHNNGQVGVHDVLCSWKNRKVWMSSSASSCIAYSPVADEVAAMKLLSSNLKWLP